MYEVTLSDVTTDIFPTVRKYVNKNIVPQIRKIITERLPWNKKKQKTYGLITFYFCLCALTGSWSGL